MDTLFAVASLRITCERLGVSEVSTYRQQVRVKGVDLPPSLEQELERRIPEATYHATTRTMNLTPDRVANADLPGWVEERLLLATGSTRPVARMAG